MIEYIFLFTSVGLQTDGGVAEDGKNVRDIASLFIQ